MQALARRYPKSFVLAALTVLGIVAYGNGLTNSFHFDDIEGIVFNPSLRELRNIPAYFTQPMIFRLTTGLDWRPVLQITYALDYALGGDPVVFHATDLLLHVVTAWFIFLIVAENLKQTPVSGQSVIPVFWIAAAPAVLFVVHTANSQTVNYSWARSSMLAALFYLLAFYCYLRGPFHQGAPGRAGWHVGGLGAFALGLASKATVASLPLILLVYEALMLNRSGENPFTLYLKQPRRLLKYLPTIAVLGAYIVVRRLVTHRVIGAFDASVGGSYRKIYLLTQFRAWMYYLKLYLWPDPLIVDYPGFGWSRSLSDPGVLVALAMILAIVIAAWAVRKRDPLLSFFTCWFFIALLPEASIIVRPDAVTGHRPYLAYAGLSVVAVLLGLKVVSAPWRKFAPSRRVAIACGVAFAVIVVALTAATIRRNLDWRSDLTLWSDVLKKDPSNVRAHMNLAVQYMHDAEYVRARELLDSAIRLEPNRAEAFFHRGKLNEIIGNYDEALNDLNHTLTLKPGMLIFAWIYRGDIYRKMGRYDDALADYERAARANANFAEAYYGIAMVYWERKELPQATAACRKFLELEPNDARSYICLGGLLMHQSHFADAMQTYYQGVARFPTNSALWYGLGTAYEELGLYKEAQLSYEKSNKLAQQSAPADSGK